MIAKKPTTVFLRLLLFPVTIINLCVNKRGWVFGSLSGLAYNDNSKYLFEYVSKHTNEKAVWLSRNMSVVEEIRSNGLEAHPFYSWRGISSALSAKYEVLSYSYDDLSILCYLLPFKSMIIQLFHGTPLKRLDVEKNRPVTNRLVRYLLKVYIGKSFDLVTGASQETVGFVKSHLDVTDDKSIAITGYPRNDALWSTSDDILEQLDITSYDKVILYLPTYREYLSDQDDIFSRYGFDATLLTGILKAKNALFLIKLHFQDRRLVKNVADQVVESKYVRLLKDSEISGDIYPLLSKTDILITDYSSVYFDYLLLNRPIIFSCFDLDDYKNHDRGFYFDYEQATPGPKVKNWHELIEQLGLILNGADGYTKERIACSQKFNKFQDDFSERVFRTIKDRC